mmetsp:Transcript_11216/g.15658  ORF Transcript_11216/g.15658 Transcript_11216/m.15658 type:complete len:87 (+) Transcript_11216:81-341(+)
MSTWYYALYATEGQKANTIIDLRAYVKTLRIFFQMWKCKADSIIMSCLSQFPSVLLESRMPWGGFDSVDTSLRHQMDRRTERKEEK